LSVDSNKHYRRPNNCKYRKDSDSGTDYYYKNGPGRRLKAVASHSPHAQPNTKAYSRHIPNEAAMHHTERKSFKLPCKYTIAASWAALRKAWLGFKIANSNDDIQKKRHYSRIIRKLQLEMGIGKTHFDLDILDDETIWQIEQEVKALESPMRQEIEDDANGLTDDDSLRDRDYDYDTLLTESMEKIKQNASPPPDGKALSVHFNREQNCQITSRDYRGSSADVNEFTYRPAPNEDKFPVYFSREKNCFVVRQDTANTAADVNEFTYHKDRSMDYMPQFDAIANPKPTGNSNKKTNSCYYKAKPEDSYQKKSSFACYYKSKPMPESEIT